MAPSLLPWLSCTPFPRSFFPKVGHSQFVCNPWPKGWPVDNYLWVRREDRMELEHVPGTEPGLGAPRLAGNKPSLMFLPSPPMWGTDLAYPARSLCTDLHSSHTLEAKISSMIFWIWIHPTALLPKPWVHLCMLLSSSTSPLTPSQRAIFVEGCICNSMPWLLQICHGASDLGNGAVAFRCFINSVFCVPLGLCVAVCLRTSWDLAHRTDSLACLHQHTVNTELQ